MRWFDGHLDLAYISQHRRDMTKPTAVCGGALAQPSVTFPSLAMGGVNALFATLFISQKTDGVPGEELLPWEFMEADQAYQAALEQVAIYQNWHRGGLIRLATESGETAFSDAAPRVFILMEGAWGVRRVEDFAQFYEAGVRIVSLTWAAGSPWSGGDRTGSDVTAAGRDLLKEIDTRGCVHDVSHLSEKAFWTVMHETRELKVASHSNCRALLPNSKTPERHLSDEQIRAIVNQPKVRGIGGIIGINLFNRFLVDATANRRATLGDVLKHIMHMEDATGRPGAEFLALGSDMDGGFGRDDQPVEVDGPEHLHRLAEGLRGIGWSDAEVEKFAWSNWANLARRWVPNGKLS